MFTHLRRIPAIKHLSSQIRPISNKQFIKELQSPTNQKTIQYIINTQTAITIMAGCSAVSAMLGALALTSTDCMQYNRKYDEDDNKNDDKN